MRKRWRLILPICGLLLFSFVSYGSFQKRHRINRLPGRYFWWGALLLDTNPPGRYARPSPPDTEPCKEVEGCVTWDPRSMMVRHGTLETILVLTALPAFVLGGVIVAMLGQLGISQVLTFMITMPVLTAVWFYFVGWLLDRRKHKLVAPSIQPS